MERRKLIAAGASMGATALTGCVENEVFAKQSTESRRASDLGLSVVKSTGSLSDSKTVHSGWVHLVADGDVYDMTFDVRVCHQPDVRVDASLSETGNGRFEVALSETAKTEKSNTSPSQTDRSECGHGTRIKGAATIPTDLDTLTFTAGSRQVLVFEKEGTVGEMRPLPDPLSWS